MVPQKFRDDLSLLGDTSLGNNILGLCTKVEQLVVRLGISDECIGFVTGGDLAKPWIDCTVGGGQETGSVSRSQVIPIAVLDAAHRPHPNSGLVIYRPRHGEGQLIYTPLWTTWNPASGSRSGV